MSYVANQPLREASERSDLSFCELARRLGYLRVSRYVYPPTGAVYSSVVGDDSRVRRALGLKRHHGKPQRFMREATALRYAEALGLDPVDIGL